MVRISEITGEDDSLILDEIYLTDSNGEGEKICEGKILSGRFDGNIRLDQPTHGAGQTHAHISGRKGVELGVVNIDGTASHGTRMKLHKKDAEVLRARGFDIPGDRVIEWTVIEGGELVLFG